MCHMITHPYFYFVTLITFILIYLSYGVCFTIWGCLTEALVWKIKWFYFILFCFVLIVIFLFIMFCLIWFHFIILVQFSPLSFVLFYFFLNIGSWGHLHTFLKFFLIMPLIFISGTGRQWKTILLKFKVIFLWWCRHFYCVHCYVLLFLMLTFLVNCGSLHILTLYFFSSPNLIQAKKVTVSNHLVIIGS